MADKNLSEHQLHTQIFLTKCKPWSLITSYTGSKITYILLRDNVIIHPVRLGSLICKTPRALGEPLLTLLLQINVFLASCSGCFFKNKVVYKRKYPEKDILENILPMNLLITIFFLQLIYSINIKLTISSTDFLELFALIVSHTLLI